MRDKRAKGCPNPECEMNLKKFRYGASDIYCTKCGTELVFVCRKCFRKIEDAGPGHSICGVCEAKSEEQKARLISLGKKVGGVALAAGAALPVAAKKLKDVDLKPIAEIGKGLLK